jgi:hypothetical protein
MAIIPNNNEHCLMWPILMEHALYGFLDHFHRLPIGGDQYGHDWLNPIREFKELWDRSIPVIVNANETKNCNVQGCKKERQ